MKFRRKAAGALSVAIVLGVTAPASAAPVPARAPTPGAGQVGAGDANRFPTWTGTNVGLYPSAVVAADLDGDGRPDLRELAEQADILDEGPAVHSCHLFVFFLGSCPWIRPTGAAGFGPAPRLE